MKQNLWEIFSPSCLHVQFVGNGHTMRGFVRAMTSCVPQRRRGRREPGTIEMDVERGWLTRARSHARSRGRLRRRQAPREPLQRMKSYTEGHGPVQSKDRNRTDFPLGSLAPARGDRLIGSPRLVGSIRDGRVLVSRIHARRALGRFVRAIGLTSVTEAAPGSEAAPSVPCPEGAAPVCRCRVPALASRSRRAEPQGRCAVRRRIVA